MLQGPLSMSSIEDYNSRIHTEAMMIPNVLQNQSLVVRETKTMIQIGNWSDAARSARMHELVERIDAAITDVSNQTWFFESDIIRHLTKHAADIEHMLLPITELVKTKLSRGLGAQLAHAFFSSLIGSLGSVSDEEIMIMSFISYINSTVPRFEVLAATATELKKLRTSARRDFRELRVLFLEDEMAYHNFCQAHAWSKPYECQAWPSQQETISRVRRTMQVTRCCLLYTSPSPRDGLLSRMPSSA